MFTDWLNIFHSFAVFARYINYFIIYRIHDRKKIQLPQSTKGAQTRKKTQNPKLWNEGIMRLLERWAKIKDKKYVDQ